MRTMQGPLYALMVGLMASSDRPRPDPQEPGLQTHCIVGRDHHLAHSPLEKLASRLVKRL
jgi:hypothetical protein